MCLCRVEPAYYYQPDLHLRTLTSLTHLQLRYGSEEIETGCEVPFGEDRVSDFSGLPALARLSVTLTNQGFEEAAARALAPATRLTSLELLRNFADVPMQFFRFYDGTEWLAPLSGLRALKMNDARFVCIRADASWSTLTLLTHLESLSISGALAILGWPCLYTREPASLPQGDNNMSVLNICIRWTSRVHSALEVKAS